MRIVATLSHRDHAIGSAESVPWFIPDARDLILQEIHDQVVVVGRRSWQLLGEQLPFYRAVVLSRGSLAPVDATRVMVVPNLSLALETASDMATDREVQVIGGASIFRQALPFAQAMTLASIKGPVPGEHRFPDYSDLEWWIEESHEHPSFELLRYSRREVA